MGQLATHTGHDINAGPPDTFADAVTEVVDRLVAGLEAAMGARPRDASRVAAALEDMIAACRCDPQVSEQLDLAWQLDELAETYSELGRVDDALETMHAAIAAGLRAGPSRCGGHRRRVAADPSGRDDVATRRHFTQEYKDQAVRLRRGRGKGCDLQVRVTV